MINTMQMPYKEAVQKYLYTKHFSISSALKKKGKKRFGTVTFTDMECFQKPTVKQHTFQ